MADLPHERVATAVLLADIRGQAEQRSHLGLAAQGQDHVGLAHASPAVAVKVRKDLERPHAGGM